MEISICMEEQRLDERKALIQEAYDAFNARDTDAALALMTPGVHWPNGWEGGFVDGQEAVREYWTRQWTQVDPTVDPVDFTVLSSGELEVRVHQVAKDMQGSVIYDGMLNHIYSFQGDLISGMRIETPESAD